MPKVIDILNLQPTKISRSIRDKLVLLYGLEKVGKTSWAANIPNNLICATEVGYHAISGATVVDIQSWTDFKMILRQLSKPEAREKYKTVTIDTISILYDLCVKFICSQNNVKAISDIPWGRGYVLVKNEFADSLRQITQMGLGLIMLAHASIKNVDLGDDTVVEQVSPLLDKRPLDIVNQLVDIIAYIEMKFDENGEATRTLITRRSPNVVAGSRFKYLPARIPFGYDELVNALVKAIDMQEKMDGAKVSDETEKHTVIEKRPFSETVAEAQELWTSIVNKDPHNADLIMNEVEKIFGESKKLSEIPESQQELFELLIEEMRTM